MKQSHDVRVIIGCLLAGLLGGLAIATSWEYKTEKSFLDVVTAFGTFAAAVIALGIALRDGIRRQRDEMTRAKLAAASVAGQLASGSKGINDAIERIENWMNGDRSQHMDLMSLMARLNSLQLVGGSKLYEMVPLPNDCAHNIAASIDLLSKVTVDAPYAFGTGEAPAGTTKEALAESCLVDLRRAAPLVVSALKECRVASGHSG